MSTQSLTNEKTLRTVVVADDLTFNMVLKACNVGDLVDLAGMGGPITVLFKDWLPSTDGGFNAVIGYDSVKS
jgi:hypothetical protein